VLGTATASILERGQQDPLVQVCCGSGRWQRPEQTQDPGAPADLGGAGRAAFDVGGQTCRVRWFELVEQERIDQGTGACAVEGVANRRVRHTIYMT
jgi:hypothetical protein